MSSHHEPAHPIQTVARRTGLTADVIRAWERRYQAVTPRRTKTRRRLYSEADVERLLLLRRATLAGRRIGDVAGLATRALAPLVESDEAAEARAPRKASPARPTAPAPEVDPGELAAAGLAALAALDSETLDAVLRRAVRLLRTEELVHDVLAPVMTAVGEGWRDGTYRICHEHLVSSMVRATLEALRVTRGGGVGAPEILVATPTGQFHELGALMAGAIAASEGWIVTYLGTCLPAEELAAAAAGRRPQAIALSLVHPSNDPVTESELRTLRRLIPEGVAIVVGGRAASSYAPLLEHLAIRRPGDAAGFIAALAEMRERPDPWRV